MLSLEIALLSERGGRKYNEDACGHWHSDRHLCCVLADGAGGHGGGDIAARLAVESMLQAFAAMPEADTPELLQLVRDTNRAVRDGRVPGTTRQDMHTTVVCLVIDYLAHRAEWAHAGDSRLYWFRGARVIDQTRDHSVVQSMVDAGMIRSDQMRTHPNRSELRSALGTQDDELEVSASDGSCTVADGDVFLLCSDGVWEYITEEALETTLHQAASPDAWLNAIEQHIEEATRGKSSHDNFTCLTVWLSASPETTLIA